MNLAVARSFVYARMSCLVVGAYCVLFGNICKVCLLRAPSDANCVRAKSYNRTKYNNWHASLCARSRGVSARLYIYIIGISTAKAAQTMIYDFQSLHHFCLQWKIELIYRVAAFLLKCCSLNLRKFLQNQSDVRVFFKEIIYIALSNSSVILLTHPVIL